MKAGVIGKLTAFGSLLSHLVRTAGLFVLMVSSTAWCDDWPMWRCDAGRTACSPQSLPAELHLQWVRHLPAPEAAWPDEPDSLGKLQFDRSYEPVVVGKILLVGSMVRDSVTAYDTDTGAEKWRFYADGPVRFAPVAAKGKVYFVSDDGYLYCLKAADGKLLRRFRGGPADKKVLGNHRLISAWPARGAPVLYDGKIYFAASIWPFMGIFIHALDAESGELIWTNSGSGSIYIRQQHRSPAFAGVAPQGYMAATEQVLLVSGGRTVPAAYDRKTGRFLYFHVSSRQFSNHAGGYNVSAVGRHFFNDGAMYELQSGKGVLSTGRRTYVYGSDAVYYSDGKEVIAGALPPAELKKVEYVDWRKKKRTRLEFNELFRASLDPMPETIFLKAGNRLYGGRKDGSVMAVDLAKDRAPAVSWRGKVQGAPWNMLAADGKLFVVTLEGRIYCFGAKEVRAKTHALEKLNLQPRSDSWAGAAKTILKQPGTTEGYCLVLGAGTGRLAEELLARSRLHVIVIDPDAKKVEALRRRWDAAGLYGTRIAAHAGQPVSFPLPPYLASLIVSQDLEAAGFDKTPEFVKKVFRALRPYGGAACFAASGQQREALRQAVARLNLPNAKLDVRSDGFVLLKRPGPLPGSAYWTHQYADAANTVVSRDRLVKAPLGLLWFGGPSNEKVLPRHGHGPSPQVVGGRLFIEGRDIIRAVDVYTGRLLWERALKDLGRYYASILHQPGAGAGGGNYVSLPDGIYIAYKKIALRLDPATGKTVKEFHLPRDEGGNEPYWGYIGVHENLLIAGATPVAIKAIVDRKTKEVTKVEVQRNTRFASASKRLVVMDRHSGELLWQREAKHLFRHNAIVAGGDRIFCIDTISAGKRAMLRRRGRQPEVTPVLYALNARTGKELWRAEEGVFGTWLGYSAERDVLLEAGSKARDRAGDEIGTGMTAYRGRDGKVIWRDPNINYRGPCMLHHDTIITQSRAVNLLTGLRVRREQPLTGEPMDWKFTRNYGCNTVIGSEHLLTFRSAAAGFYDLDSDCGTGNLGGFKSGCTSNLIAADGVLNAPDYTRTCTCSYQNQTSLALVHMPDVEVWTFQSFNTTQGRIKRLGLNFGAPGDHLGRNGTLWLDYPSVGGPSPDVPVSIDPQNPKWFRSHSSCIKRGELKSVVASGAKGLRSVTMCLNVKTVRKEYEHKGRKLVRVSVIPATEKTEPKPYTVRLYFAEPDKLKPGRRVFSVSLQGRKALPELDIVAEAGGANRTVVKEFKGVLAGNELKLTLTPIVGEPLICGIEVVAEGW